MELFVLVGISHFLALLLPGADFLLIVRLASRAGWRACLPLCSGIALGNGVYIVLAFSGLQVLQHTPWLLQLIQGLGAAYLLYLSVLLLTPNAATTLSSASQTESAAVPARRALMGLLSALLNPKNGLFYLSLASVLSQQHASTVLYVACGVWMLAVVWTWDMALARLLGAPWFIRRLQQYLPLIERAAGVMMALLAFSMLWTLLRGI